MGSREQKNVIIYLFLRFGVIIFIASTLYQIVRKPGFETSFWNDFVQVSAAIAFVLFTVLVLAMPRNNFNIFGFFVVAVGSFYMIMKGIFIDLSYTQAPVYLFLIILSFYFMTKGGETRSHRSNYF